MFRLSYETIHAYKDRYHLVVDSIVNESDAISELLSWCDETDEVERTGQYVTIGSDEEFIMFKLAWG